MGEYSKQIEQNVYKNLMFMIQVFEKKFVLNFYNKYKCFSEFLKNVNYNHDFLHVVAHRSNSNHRITSKYK